MTWRDEAVRKLKSYQAKCVALENLPDDIREQEQFLKNIRSAAPDSVSVKSGGVSRDDRILNILTLREELSEAYRQTKAWVEKMERALAVLDSEEYALLDRFYIHPEKKAADRLADDLQVDIKTVYRRKDKALRKFTEARCGALET